MKLISSILFIVITVVIFFVAIDPIYEDVKQLRTDVSTYNVALDNSTELQKTRDSLIETYKNLKQEDKDRLAHFLPSTIDNIELILEIEKIANIHGMPIGNINFEAKNLGNEDKQSADNNVVVESTPDDNLPYGVFPMEFTIEGDYNTFISFLKDLEENLRLIDIKSIAFSVPDSGAGSTNIYSYTFKIETYWLK